MSMPWNIASADSCILNKAKSLFAGHSKRAHNNLIAEFIYLPQSVDTCLLILIQQAFHII